MAANLTDLFLFTVHAFASNQIKYWLDFGTLLGQHRDNAIIPWEFDLDLGVLEEQCSRITALKPLFKLYGYTVYDRSDYIAQKARWGYSAYLHAPCIRVYDRNEAYYVNIYWYKSMTPTSARNQSVDFPTVYNGGNMVCNEDGFTHESKGGCHAVDSVFPLQTVEFLGAKVTVPQDSKSCLVDVYGTDYRATQLGGYKAFFCAYLPKNPYALHLTWMIMGGGWLLLFVAYARRI